MSRLSTVTLVRTYIDDDFAWRDKEMINLELIIRQTSDQGIKRALLRAAVPMLYAHWEGFIKKASEAVIDFVSEQRLRHDELATCFWVLGVKHELNVLAQSGNARESSAALESILASGALRTRFTAKGNVSTDSNLSSRVLERIASTIGVDYSMFETSAPLIDASLLDNRNKIAHGQFSDMDEKRFVDLRKDIFDLMRKYKWAIEDIISLKKYKRA